jgi:hypothetical protein
MTDKRKGIVDPWREVEPLRPALRERPAGKKDLEDIDFDADLEVPGKYVLRFKHVSFAVLSTRVHTPADSVDVLADCVTDMWKAKGLGPALTELGMGVRTRRAMYNVPGEETEASKLATEESALWFVGVTLDDGMAALARLMRSFEAQPIVRRHGITPMLNA